MKSLSNLCFLDILDIFWDIQSKPKFLLDKAAKVVLIVGLQDALVSLGGGMG